eukprot:3705181-Pyramimonas_sp.AAC.1
MCRPRLAPLTDVTRRGRRPPRAGAPFATLRRATRSLSTGCARGSLPLFLARPWTRLVRYFKRSGPSGGPPPYPSARRSRPSPAVAEETCKRGIRCEFLRKYWNAEDTARHQAAQAEVAQSTTKTRGEALRHGINPVIVENPV